MNLRVTITGLCKKTGMSRQNYNKKRIRRQRSKIDEDLIVELVKAERCLQPRLGGRKAYQMLKKTLEDAGVKIGRDRFYDVLRENDLLVAPLPKAPRTTNSRHSLPVYPNKLKDLDVAGPNQALVSDITYLRLDDAFAYLSLITDVYSRKIVGYHLGESLAARESIHALEMAAESMPLGATPLHHSDRGCQYCSHAYVNKLNTYGFDISMTEELHCYENALAERVNGILKQEYFLGGIFLNKGQAKQAVEQAIHLYNTRRPHMALDYRTPQEVHECVA